MAEYYLVARLFLSRSRNLPAALLRSMPALLSGLMDIDQASLEYEVGQHIFEGDYSASSWDDVVEALRSNALNYFRLGEFEVGGLSRYGFILTAYFSPESKSERGTPTYLELSIELKRYIELDLQQVRLPQALLFFLTAVWNLAPNDIKYGYSNVGYYGGLVEYRKGLFGGLRRIDERGSLGRRSLEFLKNSSLRKYYSGVPLPNIGGMVDENLKHPIAEGGGIRGAFWANLISADYLSRLNVDSEKIKSLDLEKAIHLDGGGLALFVSSTPLGAASDSELYQKYDRLRDFLRPAFISEQEYPQFASYLDQWSRENSNRLAVGAF